MHSAVWAHFLKSLFYLNVYVFRDIIDTRQIEGLAMLARGSISPLLGAVYLTPLDRAMTRLEMRSGIRYLRYLDDFLSLPPLPTIAD